MPAVNEKLTEYISKIDNFHSLPPAEQFILAVNFITAVQKSPVAVLNDIKDFYTQAGLNIPGNFGGEIRQLTRKPKRIIKKNNKYTLTQYSKRWVESAIGNQNRTVPKINEEDKFLAKKVDKLSINKLKVSRPVQAVINQRVDEIERCMKIKAPLATIFLCGSTLEGLLLEYANLHIADFNRATSAPKDRNTRKVLPLAQWKLTQLIDTASKIGIIDEDVKRFSDNLREFRNYIHPNKQVSVGFNPTMHTAEICHKVLEIAIVQLGENG